MANRCLRCSPQHRSFTEFIPNCAQLNNHTRVPGHGTPTGCGEWGLARQNRCLAVSQLRRPIELVSLLGNISITCHTLSDALYLSLSNTYRLAGSSHHRCNREGPSDTINSSRKNKVNLPNVPSRRILWPLSTQLATLRLYREQQTN